MVAFVWIDVVLVDCLHQLWQLLIHSQFHILDASIIINVLHSVLIFAVLMFYVFISCLHIDASCDAINLILHDGNSMQVHVLTIHLLFWISVSWRVCFHLRFCCKDTNFPFVKIFWKIRLVYFRAAIF